MEEKKVIDVLRHYRHDLLNDLQIIHGYASMGKIDIVREKVTDCINHYNEERKLINLNAPQFALWLIQFNSLHTNFRFTYHINIENNDLHASDGALVKQCKNCIDVMEKFAKKTVLYDGTFHVYQDLSSNIILKLQTQSEYLNVDELKANLENMEQEFAINVQIEEDNSFCCSFSIPCNK